MKIAHWISQGGKWEAVLDRNIYGYRLSERKHGHEVGVSFRPFAQFNGDEAAKEYFQAYVPGLFDVKMKRVA